MSIDCMFMEKFLVEEPILAQHDVVAPRLWESDCNL